MTFDAVESMRRQLAAELGPRGIRVVTLHTGGLPAVFAYRDDLLPYLGLGRDGTSRASH